MCKIIIVVLITGLLIAETSFVSASDVIFSSTDIDSFQKMTELSKYELANCTDPSSPIYDPAVLKAYGKIPPVHNATQLNEFADKLRNVRDSSWDEIDFYPNGSVVRYGSDPARGYFLIELYDSGRQKSAYSETDTRKIYNIVDKYAIQNDIEDVPVAFTLTNETEIIGFIEFPVYRYDLDNETMEEINASLDQSTEDAGASSLPGTNSANKLAPVLGVWGSLLMVFAANFFSKRNL